MPWLRFPRRPKPRARDATDRRSHRPACGEPTSNVLGLLDFMAGPGRLRPFHEKANVHAYVNQVSFREALLPFSLPGQ